MTDRSWTWGMLQLARFKLAYCDPDWVAACFTKSTVQARPTMPSPSLLVPVPFVSVNWALMS
jgi:hypothetical protein